MGLLSKICFGRFSNAWMCTLIDRQKFAFSENMRKTIVLLTKMYSVFSLWTPQGNPLNFNILISMKWQVRQGAMHSGDETGEAMKALAVQEASFYPN